MPIARRQSLASIEKPMGLRFFVVASLLSLSAPARAQVWTEEAVIARVTERTALAELGEARAAAERGAGRTERAWPPIDVTYTREQTFGVGGTGEDYLGASVPLDLANRRGLRGEAYDHRALAALAGVDSLRRERVAIARQLLHRVAAGRARVAALEAWLGEIESVLRSVETRVAAGDASRYDALRLERERATAMARRDSEASSVTRDEAELAALLGVPQDGLVVATEALPDAPPALTAVLETASALPDLRVWDEREEASRLDEEAAARGWVPELALSIGWKGVELMNLRNDGFYAGAVLAIPIFDLGLGARDRARAEARIAAAQREILRAEIEREVRGAHAEAVALRRAALDFAEASGARSEELVRVASAAYAGGEASLLELLDAERGAIEDRLVLVDLSLRAWEARIELERAAGEEESR